MKKFDSSYDRGQAMNLAAVLAGRKNQISMPRPGGELEPPEHVAAIEGKDLGFAPPPEVSFRDEGVYRDQVWQMLLRWALDVTDSAWVYVCDTSGLVIAETGIAPQSGEEIPSILVSVLDKLKRCSQHHRLPDLLLTHLDNLWTTVLCFSGDETTAEAEGLVIGLVGEAYPMPEAIKHVGKVFKEKIALS